MDVKESRLFELGSICEAVEGTEGLVWKATFIEAGRSANGRNYPADVLERSVPLFDKASVYIDHPSKSEEKDRPERSIRDIAGWITNPQWDPEGGSESKGAVIGQLHLLESSPAAAQIREAYERGNPDLVQLSIFGRIRAVPVRENGSGYWNVKEIDKIRSVDLVTLAAAGGRIMDVMQSIREEDEMDMLENMTLEEILELRPDLKDKLAVGESDDGDEEDVLEVIQKAVATAVQNLLSKISKAEKLSDAADKAVKTARLAVGRGDAGAAIKELGKLSKDSSVPEELQKEAKELIAKLGYSEPAKAEEQEEEDEEDEEEDEDKVKKESQDTAVEAVRSELEELRHSIKVAECTRKAVSKVQETKLPQAMKDKLIAEFSDRVFEDDELDKAISEETEVYESILAENPRPEVRVTRDARDKMADVVTATIMGETYNDAEPFQSLHRAYCMFTGQDPYKLTGGALASRLVHESIGFDQDLNVTEAISWTNVFGTAMNRVLAKDYKLPVFNEWELIVSDIKPLKDTRAQYVQSIGYYGVLPTVNSGAPYTYATSPGEDQESYTPAKKGILEEWTWEDALNDDLGALRKIPKRLSLAAKMTLYQFVFDDLLDDNPTLDQDSVALFHGDHNNYSTNALSSDNLTTAKIAMRRQYAKGTTDLRLATKPKYILVPTTLESTAMQIIKSDTEVTSDKDATVYNPHKNTLEVVTVDHWSVQTRWYLVADPNIMPTIELGFLDGKRVPQIFTEATNSGSSFSADKVVIKIRFVFGGTVVDYRSFYGGRPS